jgi:hypothetical protein
MKKRTGIAIGCILATLLPIGGCGLFMVVVHFLLPAGDPLPDGRTLVSIVETLEPGMSFSNVVSSFPSQFVDRAEAAITPRYTGAILSATNAIVAKALYCRGRTSMRDGYPVPDEAILYFNAADQLIGLNWSSYTRNVGWKPKPTWGTSVVVRCNHEGHNQKVDPIN